MTYIIIIIIIMNSEGFDFVCSLTFLVQLVLPSFLLFEVFLSSLMSPWQVWLLTWMTVIYNTTRLLSNHEQWVLY